MWLHQAALDMAGWRNSRCSLTGPIAVERASDVQRYLALDVVNLIILLVPVVPKELLVLLEGPGRPSLLCGRESCRLLPAPASGCWLSQSLALLKLSYTRALPRPPRLSSDFNDASCRAKAGNAGSTRFLRSCNARNAPPLTPQHGCTELVGCSQPLPRKFLCSLTVATRRTVDRSCSSLTLEKSDYLGSRPLPILDTAARMHWFVLSAVRSAVPSKGVQAHLSRVRVESAVADAAPTTGSLALTCTFLRALAFTGSAQEHACTGGRELPRQVETSMLLDYKKMVQSNPLTSYASCEGIQLGSR